MRSDGRSPDPGFSGIRVIAASGRRVSGFGNAMRDFFVCSPSSVSSLGHRQTLSKQRRPWPTGLQLAVSQCKLVWEIERRYLTSHVNGLSPIHPVWRWSSSRRPDQPCMHHQRLVFQTMHCARVQWPFITPSKTTYLACATSTHCTTDSRDRLNLGPIL